MADIYDGRGQTAAKHFILRRYLQALAFKLMQGGFPILSYVDGFSGPWESKAGDHSDTSFMIAINVLKDAQQRAHDAKGKRPEVRCFFSEMEAGPYAQLRDAVMKHHDPASRFFIETYHGRFEDAVDEIMKMIGTSFALTFIDPTGWTGYELPKIARLLAHKPGEVLINYMKPFIDRFTAWDHPKNTTSFNGILGEGWQSRLDKSLPRDEAVYLLFAEQLRTRGGFRHVVSTPIQKDAGEESFSIVYGTRDDRGLDAYRDAEFDALRNQWHRRDEARKAHNAASGIIDLFDGFEMALPVEAQVKQLCRLVREHLLSELRVSGPIRFGSLWPTLLASFMIRKTNAKTICADLAKEGMIRPSWKDRNKKARTPDDEDIIELA